MWKHWIRLGALAALVVLSAVAPVAAQAPAAQQVAAPAGPESWDLDEVRRILADRVDVAEQSVGMVVGLIDGGGRIVIGHGRLGPDDATTPDGRTVYEIGSVTKVFTAVLLAQMAGQGEVGLQDPVQKYLPDTVRLPVQGERGITLYDLTTHTSGLPRMPDNFTPADPANPYADYTVEQLYAFVMNHTPERAPGERAEYSNLGAGLLGHVLARRADSDYATLVRERITRPLGMNDTAIELSGSMRERLARGHDGSLNPVANWDIATLAGAGALRSTADDMLRFVAANLGADDGPLAAALAETRKPREAFSGDDTRIGLGWIVSTRNDRTIHWHNGGTGGYHSFVGLDHEHGRGLVVLSNAAPSIDDIGMHLLDPEFPLADPQPPATLAALPDSPAGRALRDWLAAIRAEEEDAARTHYEAAFADSFKSSVPVDAYMGLRGQLRGALAGAEVERVVVRGEHDLSGYAPVGGVWLGIHIQVTPDEPHRIVGLLVQPAEPPAAPE